MRSNNAFLIPPACIEIDVEEWNFSKVPDEELEAACIWEYSRESHTITEAQIQYELLLRELKLKRERHSMNADEIEKEEQFLAEMKGHGREIDGRHDEFLKKFYNCDLGYNSLYSIVRKYGGAFAETWLRLPTGIRAKLVTQARHSDAHAGLRLAWRRDLRRLWNINAFDENAEEDLSGAWEDVTPIISEPSHEGDKYGETIVTFNIDFKRYNDREIIEALSEWLIQFRPLSCPQPTRRGRKVRDYRVALERLGLMRLLHCYTPSQMRVNVPDAWKLYGAKEGDFRKEVKAAIAWFRRSFSFLPEDEVPYSACRKGVQSRKMRAHWGD